MVNFTKLKLALAKLSVCLAITFLPFRGLNAQEVTMIETAGITNYQTGYIEVIPPIVEQQSYPDSYLIYVYSNVVQEATPYYCFTTQIKGQTHNPCSSNNPHGETTEHFFLIVPETDISGFSIEKFGSSGTVIFGPHNVFYEVQPTIEELPMRTSGVGGVSMEWYSAYGISPLRPDEFLITNKPNYYNDTTFNIDKATEGDTILFEISSSQNYTNFIVEKSLDGGETWQSITNNQNGSPSPITTGFSYVIDSFDSIDSIDGLRKIKFRARTYCSANRVVGRSYGYLEETIDVYPRPNCDDISDIYMCHDQTTYNEGITISNIDISQYVDSVRISVEKLGDTGWNTEDGMDVTVSDSNTDSIVFNKEGLETGEYRVALENYISIDNENEDDDHVYQCGHNYKNFKIANRHHIRNFFSSEISITCHQEYANQSLLKPIQNIKIPSNAAVGIKGPNDSDYTQLESPFKYTIYPGTFSVNTSYTDGPSCPDTFNIVVENVYPLVTINNLNITYGCNGTADTFLVSDGDYEITKEGTTNDDYYLKYLVSTSGWNSINNPISGKFNAGEVKAGIGVFTDNTLKCVYSNMHEYNPLGKINYEVTANSLSYCGSAHNGSITLSNPENVFFPCTVVLKKRGVAIDKLTWEEKDSITFEGLSAGSYEVTLTDDNGCSATKHNISIGFSGNPFAIEAINATSVSPCSYSTNGQIKVTPTGEGSDNFWVSVDGTTWFSEATVAGLEAGSYTVYARPYNEEGCIVEQNATIEAPQPLALSYGVTQPTCSYSSNGEIELTHTPEGKVEYYLLTDEADSLVPSTIENVGRGSYSFFAINQNGCHSDTISIEVTAPDTLLVENINPTHASCFGEDGEVTLSVNGGTAPYTCTFTNTASNVSFELVLQASGEANQELPSGNYLLKISDSMGCEASEIEFEITQPNPIEISFSQPNEAYNGYYIQCNGGEANYDVTISGGTPSYTLSTSYSEDTYNVENTITFSSIADTISYWAIDNNLCESDIFQIVINQPEQLIIDTVQLTPPSCYNGDDGMLEVFALGGVEPYNYTIISSATGNSLLQEDRLFSGLAADEYFVEITDKNICPSSTLVTLPNAPEMTLGLEATSCSCHGTADGSISVSLKGEEGVERIVSIYSGIFEDINDINIPPHSTLTTSSDSVLIPNLLSGPYTLTYTYSNSECVVLDSVFVPQPNVLGYTIAPINVECYSSSTGKVRIQVEGGNAPYNLTLFDINETLVGSISTAENEYYFNGLPEEYYYIHLSDSKGCNVTPPAETTVFVSNPPSELSLVLEQHPAHCYNSPTGEIMATAEGGWDNYSFSTNNTDWVTVEANQNAHVFNNLLANEHQVWVRDGNNCTVSQITEVTQPAELVIDNVTTTPTTCYGGSNGSLTVYASGGNGGYQYSIGDGFIESNMFSGLAAGVYTVSIRDSLGCSNSVDVTINHPLNFTLEVVTNSYNGYNIGCYGQTDSVKLVPTGATPPYSFSLNDSIVGVCEQNDTLLIANIKAGNYSVAITDANGCEYSQSFELTQPDSLSFASITVVEPLCYNGSNGSIEVNGMEGGVPNYSYWLYNQESDLVENVHNTSLYVFEGLSSQSYTISATDANGCMTHTSVYIDQPDEILITSYNIVNIKCKGDSSGSITVDVSGGNGPYDYLWFNEGGEIFSSQNPLENQPAGIYTLSVSDTNGCILNSADGDMDRTVYEIVEPDEALLISNVQLEQPTCYGDGDGLISFESLGGWDNNHSYAINDELFGSGSTFTYLPAGNYQLHVKDGMGCIATESISLHQPDSLVLLAQAVTDAHCFGDSNGEVMLSAAGGNGGYMYGFYNQAQTNSPVFSNLSAGNYSFWVSDTKGCTGNTEVQVNEPQPIEHSITNIVAPACDSNTGSFDVVASGGIAPFSITWDSHALPGSFSQVGLTADSYSFTITDLNGCTQSFSYNLSSIDAPSISSYNATEPTCSYRSDGSIEIEIESNAPIESIAWTDSSNSTWPGNLLANNLPAGSYTVRVADNQGCVGYTDILLTSPEQMSALVDINHVVCYGESSGSSSINLQGGTYPYTVQWYNSSNQLVGSNTEVENLSPDTYSVTVSDSNGCGFLSDNDHTISEINISEPEQPLSVELLSMHEPTCFAGSNAQVVLSANGGWGSYLYSLNESYPSTNPSFKNLTAGTHSAAVTDVYGCTAMLQVEVTEPNPVQINVIEKDDVTCFGDSNGMVRVSAVNGTSPYSYSANNGETWNNHGVFNSLPFGQYNIIAKDLHECSATISTTVNQPNPLVASIDTLSPAYCGTNNGWVTIQVDGGTSPFTSHWEHLETPQGLAVDGLAPGSYAVNIIDANQCNGSITLTVPEVDGPQIHSFDVVSPTCFGYSNGSIQIDFSGVSSPFNFLLNGSMVGSSLAEGLPSGNYTFTVVDKYSCADSISILVDEPTDIAVGFSDISSPLCDGQPNGSVTASAAGGTPPYSYAWSTGITGTTMNNAAAGLFSVQVTDANQCVKTSDIELENSHPVLIDLPSSVALCQGQSVTLDAQNPGSMYWWTSNSSFESFDRVVTLDEEGEYYLQVTHQNGCVGVDTVAISKYDYVVSSTLLVPGTAMVGDTVVVIDISWPIPELIEWVIPNEFTVLLDNPYEKHLIPNAEGEFLLSLISSTGECMAINQKSISISGFNMPPLPTETSQTLIKWVNILPNPAHDATSIEVALNREASITIQLFNSYGFPIKQVERSNADFYSYRLPLTGLAPGVYLVKVIAEDAQQTVRLIVN